MGKKGGSNKAPQAAAPAAAPPENWEEYLEENPELKRAEEEKKAERQRKAEEAQRQQKLKNERREAWEKQQVKDTRKKDREDAKWTREVQATVARALNEGVKEAEMGEDGLWYVDMGTKGKHMWMEVSDTYYCTICEKHLNDATIGAHISSDKHTKRLAWAVPGAAPSLPSGPPPASQPAPVSQPPVWGPRPGSKIRLEEWQKLEADGVIRCLPCGKVYDELHGSTADHNNRVLTWLETKRLEEQGYPAPKEPHLAYVLSDEKDPKSERWIKCLLCNKWCQDETSHVGTHEDRDPLGSKEHLKNLRNCRPGDPWYRENVTKWRQHWHPPRPAAADRKASGAAASSSQAPWAKAKAAPEAPPRPPAPEGLPEGWEAVYDAGSGRHFYYHEVSKVSTWDINEAMKEAAPAPAPAEAPHDTQGAAPEPDDIEEV